MSTQPTPALPAQLQAIAQVPVSATPAASASTAAQAQVQASTTQAAASSIASSAASGQSNQVPVPAYSNPFFPTATLTPNIYWAAQPPAVRALRGMDPTLVGIAAKKLADQGYIVDVYIMVYQYDAVTAMGIRQNNGFTWVPSADQPNIPTMPGCSVPGLPNYDPNNPPAGSIKVSLNAVDYPPFDPPPPPAPPAATNVVGIFEYGNVYSFGPGAKDSTGKWTVVDGQVVTQNGVKYTAHLSVNGLMGDTLDFTINSPQ